jgi:hypothetical protein
MHIFRFLVPRDSPVVVNLTKVKLSSLPTDMRAYKEWLYRWVDDRKETRAYAKEVCMMTQTNPDVFSTYLGLPGEHENELRLPLNFNREVIAPMLEAFDRLTNHSEELRARFLTSSPTSCRTPTSGRRGAL